MPIKVTKAFQWSPNGYDVASVDAGEYESLPERASRIAVQLGALEGEAAPPSPASAGSVPQLPAEGQVAPAGPAGVEGAGGSTPTSEPPQSAVIEGGAEVAKVKARRRGNRSSEPVNG